MLIYNETSLAFRKKCLHLSKIIMETEMGLKLKRNRFQWNNYLIPLSFVVFEHEKVLGHFNHHLYQVGFNKKLMYEAKDSVLKNIIRHELTHLICFLKFNNTVDQHGAEYKSIAKSYGWDKEVYSAYMSIEQSNHKKEGEIESEKIISRIKKLLALASSQNQNEAELATMKANELLLKHNLKGINQDSQDEAYVRRVLSGKRKSVKHQAIYDILSTFEVQPVFNQGKGQYYLEVIGDRVSVEISDYIANILDKKLEDMWKQAQKENPELKGITPKNSFFRGVAKGYISKIKGQKESIIANSKSLISLKKELQKKVSIVHGKTSLSYSKQAKSCTKSNNIGNKMGKLLSFKKGLNKKHGTQTFLLE